ncbi:MAG: glycosyltransferase family 4 protein [Chloroflexi bacterium]|nr:glycosyltransferase family 4 protein [Chloroflexota bacterium]
MADRPARVLHILSGGTIGGCEQHVLALLSRLDRRRFEPWLACFEAEPDAATPMLPMFRAAGVRVIDLKATRRTDPAAIWRLGRLLRRGQFDIVHAHSFRTELAAVCWSKLAGLAPRVVRSVHNMDDYYVHPRYSPLLRASACGLDRIVAISDAVADYLRTDGGLPPEKIVRIYYGIDPSPYRPDAPPPSRRAGGDPPGESDRPTIGVVARLAPQKGHRVLFDALPQIAAAVPGVHARLVGHEELSTVAELRQAACERGVDHLVTFEGFRSDIANVMADLDVFVLPSLWEGFGLVLVEAMAAGRPVVASAVGPIPEIVVDGVTGLLVPPGDPVALAEAITRLLRDPELAAAYGRAGRARVEQELRLDTMVERMEALYDELLGRDAL